MNTQSNSGAGSGCPATPCSRLLDVTKERDQAQMIVQSLRDSEHLQACRAKAMHRCAADMLSTFGEGITPVTAERVEAWQGIVWGENGPIEAAYSREEILCRARQWMKDNYPTDDRDAWATRFGLLVDFLSDMFPANSQDQASGRIG